MSQKRVCPCHCMDLFEAVPSAFLFFLELHVCLFVPVLYVNLSLDFWELRLCLRLHLCLCHTVIIHLMSWTRRCKNTLRRVHSMCVREFFLSDFVHIARACADLVCTFQCCMCDSPCIWRSTCMCAQQGLHINTDMARYSAYITQKRAWSVKATSHKTWRHNRKRLCGRFAHIGQK